ncbi:hypothetical protein [Achromobacter arsenitoxydans]|nr:hypothetical protein [Achromobacter arsenitoxydans]
MPSQSDLRFTFAPIDSISIKLACANPAINVRHVPEVAGRSELQAGQSNLQRTEDYELHAGGGSGNSLAQLSHLNTGSKAKCAERCR